MDPLATFVFGVFVGISLVGALFPRIVAHNAETKNVIHCGDRDFIVQELPKP